MPSINTGPRLDPADFANLRESGLTDETIRANLLRTESRTLVFPYRNLDGTVNCFARRRPHDPPLIGGKRAKYVQPPGTPPRAYYPFAALNKLRDPGRALYVGEGEKKALALGQLGLAAVGIGGVDCGCHRTADGRYELIPDLARLPLAGRTVYLVPDFDPKPETRARVSAAMGRLAAAFLAAGAGEVRVVTLPPGPEGGKNGADDFLVANGAFAFGELIGRASAPVPAGGSGIIPVIPAALEDPAFHGPVGDFLRAVDAHTEATPAAILAHLLPVVGARIGPGPHVFAGGRHPARVNTAVVGPTSTGRKGTAAGVCSELMMRADPDFWEAQRVGGLSTGEGLIARVADKVRRDEDGNEEVIPVDKRLYVLEPELSRVLAQVRREGNVLSQVLRESFDTGDLSVLTRQNPLTAHGAHIAVTGHITPEELKDRLNHIEMANGFGNRFAWFLVRSDKLLPRCEPIPDAVFEPLARRLRPLKDRPDQCYPLTPDAAWWWEEELYPLLRADAPGFAGAMTARGTAIVLRLALLYFLLDPPRPGLARGIGRAHLEAAMAVWRYCEASARTLFGDRQGTTLGDKLLGLLAGGPVTKDQLNDHLSPGQKRQADAALAALESAGRIRKCLLKRIGPGRPATAWEEIPRIIENPGAAE